MSIMISAADTHGVAGAGQLDTELRALLDHVAVELAEEYIRLMEKAATKETAEGTSAIDI
jgi:hypothetical protein